MDFTFSPEAPWKLEDLDARTLEEPPPVDFDCGADDQNQFLQERAWRDHQKGISATHMMYVNGIPAAYVTLMADRIKLSPKEKLKGISYELVPAVKIAQLAVARRFSGHGLGKFMVGYAVASARAMRAAPGVGCRYLTLDSQPHLVGWYERMGFKRNIEEQKIRQQLAIERNRALEELAVSMRFDLRDLHDE